MASPTAAGRTDSPTTSPSAVLPDEYRDLERYGFDDWSGARRCFGPLGRHSGACEELAANLRPLVKPELPAVRGSVSAAVDAATFVTGQAMVVDGGLPRPSCGRGHYANPPVPICSPLWDEEALSDGCQSAGSTRVTSVHVRNAALKVDHFWKPHPTTRPLVMSAFVIGRDLSGGHRALSSCRRGPSSHCEHHL
jgi:hypothetical protein